MDLTDLILSPKEFMSNCIVRVKGGLTWGMATSARYDLTFEREDSWHKAKREGNNKSIPVYYLRVGTPGLEQTFKGYYCGYKADETVTAQLSSKADYFFSVRMDGCTLGIGSQSGDGSCLVAHANRKSDGAQMRAEQSNDLESKIRKVSMMQPRDYSWDPAQDKDDTQIIKATPLGWRDGKRWTFMYQKYRKTGSSTYENMGVFPIHSW
jgi:hypothetical protein